MCLELIQTPVALMERPSWTAKGQLGPSERTAERVLSYWELEPPERPLSMVTDHTMYGLTGT